MIFKNETNQNLFSNKINSIESSLNKNLALKDNLTCIKKSGRLFRLLSKLISLFIDVNKHTNIDRIAQNIFTYCHANRNHITQEHADTVARIFQFLEKKTKKNCTRDIFAVQGLVNVVILPPATPPPPGPPAEKDKKAEVPLSSSSNLSQVPIRVAALPPAATHSTIATPATPQRGLAAVLANGKNRLKKAPVKQPPTAEELEAQRRAACTDKAAREGKGYGIDPTKAVLRPTTVSPNHTPPKSTSQQTDFRNTLKSTSGVIQTKQGPANACQQSNCQKVSHE